MKRLNISKTIFGCLVACGVFLTASNQANAQVTYTYSGFANNLELLDAPESPVQVGEAFTAVFEIDTSVEDSELADPTVGVYEGAITSSSIVFSEGASRYVSTVDFSGGTVTIRPDSGGGGIILQDASDLNLGSIVLYSPVTFDSDALVINSQVLIGSPFDLELPGSLLSLNEGAAGFISSGTPVSAAGTGPLTLSVSTAAVPEPTSLSLLGLGVVIASVRRRRK